MFAVLWRFGEADISVFIDPVLIDKEVLMDLHNSCKDKKAQRICWCINLTQAIGTLEGNIKQLKQQFI